MKPAKNDLIVAVTATDKAVDARNRVAIKTARPAADVPVVPTVPVPAAREKAARVAMATAIALVVRAADRPASTNAISAMSARVRKPRRNHRNSTPALRPKKKASNPSRARSR